MFQLVTAPLSYWLPPLLAGLITATIAILVLLRRPSLPSFTLSLYLFSASVWSLCYWLELHSATLDGVVFWSKVQYLGMAGLPLAGLIFLLQYNGFTNWVTVPRVLALSAVPAITQVMVWTNARHGLIWARVWRDLSTIPFLGVTHGAWYWVFTGYCYALCLASFALLSMVVLRRRGVYRSQAAVLLGGSLVPFAFNVVHVLGFSRPGPHLDFTSFAFSVTGLTMAWGLFRFQLPAIMPAARRSVIEGMSDGVIVVDNNRQIVEVNPEACTIFGFEARSAIGRPAANIFSAHHKILELCEAFRETRFEMGIGLAGEQLRYDVKCSLLFGGSRAAIGALIVLRDITERKLAEEMLREAHGKLERRVAERTAVLSQTIEELRQAQDQLSFNATHDHLTGLANRALFLDRLGLVLKLAREPFFAIFYLDVDGFKRYNDGYGHATGDEILVQLASRLRRCFRETDIVARMGGDEFTVLVEDPDASRDADRLAQRCRQAVAVPLHIAGHEIHVTASIGIAICEKPGQSADELVRNADMAMYRAKRLGGNRHVVFGHAMASPGASLAHTEEELRHALAHGEIVVWYQPIVSMTKGTIAGFEALVRWHHPERGVLLPAKFLPVAERTGLTASIDELVLREACRQGAEWRRAASGTGDKPFVSVNLCGWQFDQEARWWQALSAALAESRLDPSGLRLEVTESVMAAHADESVEFFEKLRREKLQIDLDDFGTGYSSLSWLSRFPIRNLKIDQSFVDKIETGGKDLSIIRTIVTLAHSLEMGVVAEGVEREAQYALLKELGCDYGQGLYFGSPVDAGGAQALRQNASA